MPGGGFGPGRRYRAGKSIATSRQRTRPKTVERLLKAYLTNRASADEDVF